MPTKEEIVAALDTMTDGEVFDVIVPVGSKRNWSGCIGVRSFAERVLCRPVSDEEWAQIAATQLYKSIDELCSGIIMNLVRKSALEVGIKAYVPPEPSETSDDNEEEEYDEDEDEDEDFEAPGTSDPEGELPAEAAHFPTEDGDIGVPAAKQKRSYKRRAKKASKSKKASKKGAKSRKIKGKKSGKRKR